MRGDFSTSPSTSHHPVTPYTCYNLVNVVCRWLECVVDLATTRWEFEVLLKKHVWVPIETHVIITANFA